MSDEVRKDSRGRKLWNGETQDKEGRYVYRYTDGFGNRKAIYSWKLTDADRVPRGKHDDIPLREKEKLIQKDLENQLNSSGRNITLYNQASHYLDQKMGVRYGTMQCYRRNLNVMKNDPFLQKKIRDIKISDAKKWVKLQQDNGLKARTIYGRLEVLKPALQLAVEEDLIPKNPFNFKMSNVLTNDSDVREAITVDQEERFLEFLRTSNCYSKYYDAIFILFHTGLRISELSGLTMDDIDMENGLISVNHQVCRRPRGGSGSEVGIAPPKTKSGNRVIPMSKAVKERFESVLKKRATMHSDISLRDDDGKIYRGFLFINTNGNVTEGCYWTKRFNRAVARYNETHSEEERLPNITPHVARHTFCSNMANAGVNAKQLQYIMGHSRFEVTFDVYSHVHPEDLGDIMENA